MPGVLIPRQPPRPKRPALTVWGGYQANPNLARQGPTKGGPLLPGVPGAAPAAPAAPPATAVSTPDPRDSTYQTQLAQLLAGRDNQLTDYAAARSRANESVYGQRGSLAQLAEARTKALDTNKVNASRGGIFYSGILGKDLADTNQGYDNQQADVVAALTRQLEDIATGESRAKQSYDLGQGSAYNDAVQRALQGDATLAQQGALTAPPTPAAAAPAGAPAAAQPQIVPGHNSRGEAGHWHIYPGPGGRRVFVKS